MKRTISFLLACLLVAGMLPTHVHAQETEPVVMETTIAATEPTEAMVEPIPETTVPVETTVETTPAAEVVAETTAPTETPEETVPETISQPEATLPVTEVTVENEAAEEAAAMQLLMDAAPSAETTPEDAVISEELITVFSSEDSIALYGFGDHVYREAEDNDLWIWANPIGNDYTVKGRVSMNDTMDDFAFQVSSTSKVTITAISSLPTMRLYLLDSEPTILQSVDAVYNSSIGYYQYVITRYLQPGVHYISILDLDSYGTSYTFHLDIRPCSHSSYSTSKVYPKCTEQGYTLNTCKSCGHSWKSNITSALGHKYGPLSTTQPTCTKTGSKTKTCSTCGYKNVETIPAKGHSYGGWVITKDPACTTEGVKTKTCSVCKYQTQESVPATGHRPGEWTVTKDPTCTEEGVSTKFCTVCLAIVEEKPVEIIPHTYHNWAVTKAPSCTETGVNTQFCKYCDHQITEDIPMVVHVYGDWAVTKEPTCTKTGVNTKTCLYCGNQVTEEIPTLPHTYGEKVLTKAPTQTAEGTITMECTAYGCYDKTTESIPALGSSVTEYVIADDVVKIGANAFYDYSFLTKVVIPNSVTEIGKSAFNGCSGLSSIEIPNSVTDIDSHAFDNCSSLTSVTLPSSLKTLASYTFQNCTALTSVVIPEGVTTIGECAFGVCTNLTSVSIPSTVTKMEQEVFYRCTALENVYITDLAAWCNIEYSKSGTHDYGTPMVYANKLYLNGQLLTDCVIPTGVNTISSYAFYNCRSITSVTIPNSVTTIGHNAFRNCTGLTEVAIASRIKTIAYSVFEGCSNLSRVTIPDGVTAIGEKAFNGCKKLTNLTLPHTLTHIYDYAFFGCEAITEITFPASVSFLGYYAFGDCTGLKKIYFIGDAPELVSKKSNIWGNVTYTTSYPFDGVTATAYYPEGNKTYTYRESYTQYPPVYKIITGFGGDLTWYTCYHSFQYGQCSKCGAKGNADGGCVHNLEPATCTNVARCTKCYKAFWGTQLGHAFSSYQENGDYTCISYGTETATCARCGVTNTRPIERSNGGYLSPHKFTSKPNGDATCITNGTETLTCDVCGHTKTQAAKDGALGHSFTNYVSNNDASCSTHGTKTAKCDRCEITNTLTDLDNLAGHKEVTLEAKAPTCTETGLTEGKQCSVCKETLVKQEEVPALGHDYVDRVCTRCGAEKYSITRVSGKDRHDTAFKIANMLKSVLNVEKFDTILIASGSDSADALAGSYLAAMKGAPILLSRNNSHPRNLAYIQENLSDNGIVYILGGTGAVPQEMENLLIENGINYERVKGADRFGTNLEILKKAGEIQGNEILVSTAYNFADSLSASATGKPILLVNSKRNVLTNAQKAYLAEITAGGPKTFTIIGGTGAVSDELATALSAYGTVNREKGTTREATSVRVAEVYFQNPDMVFLAYSRNFPDGLCGGPLAYATKAPLLLVNTKQETPAAEYVAENGIVSVCILGGTAAVSDESVKKIFP